MLYLCAKSFKRGKISSGECEKAVGGTGFKAAPLEVSTKDIVTWESKQLDG